MDQSCRHWRFRCHILVGVFVIGIGVINIGVINVDIITELFLLKSKNMETANMVISCGFMINPDGSDLYCPIPVK